MSLKRNNEITSIVPVTKKPRNEVAIVSNNDNNQQSNSSLFAPIVVLTGHEGEIYASKFNPDGTILASAGFDRKIFLWDYYNECSNFAAINAHNGAILEIKFSNDGTELVSCSTDKTVLIWDLSTCERIKKYKGHKNYVNSVDISRTSSNLICSGSDDNTVKIWDRRKKGETTTLDSTYQVLTVAFNENSEQVISGGIDNDLKVWDLRKNEVLYKLRGHTDCPTGLSLSPDGSFIASNAMDNTVRIWDIRPYASNDRCVKLLHGHQNNFEKNLLRVAWSPESSLLSAGSADKFLYIWEFDNGKILYKLPGHIGSVNDVDFHPTEPIICSCSSDKRIFLGEI